MWQFGKRGWTQSRNERTKCLQSQQLHCCCCWEQKPRWRGRLLFRGDLTGQVGTFMLTVNHPFQVIITSPQLRPLVQWSCDRGVWPSPYTSNTGSTRGLLGSLLAPSRGSMRRLAAWRHVASPRPGWVRAATLFFCFSTALLSKHFACGRKSVHFSGSRKRRRPISCSP